MLTLGAPELLLLCSGYAVTLGGALLAALLLAAVVRRIPPAERQLRPAQVWLLLVPVFNVVWSFVVFTRVSRSLKAHFDSAGRTDVGDCGYGVGLACCICGAGAIVPLLGCLSGLVSLVLLVIYLTTVARRADELGAGKGLGAGVILAVIVLGVALPAVLAVVGILAAIAIPNFVHAKERAKQVRTMADLRSIGAAVEQYSLDQARYPAAADFEALRGVLAPQYIKSMPERDAWGRPLAVHFTADQYCVVSYGRDGRPDLCTGGAVENDDADICFCNGRFAQWPAGMSP